MITPACEIDFHSNVFLAQGLTVKVAVSQLVNSGVQIHTYIYLTPESVFKSKLNPDTQALPPSSQTITCTPT